MPHYVHQLTEDSQNFSEEEDDTTMSPLGMYSTYSDSYSDAIAPTPTILQLLRRFDAYSDATPTLLRRFYTFYLDHNTFGPRVYTSIYSCISYQTIGPHFPNVWTHIELKKRIFGTYSDVFDTYSDVFDTKTSRSLAGFVLGLS
jgi:hypothetical protein